MSPRATDPAGAPGRAASTATATAGKRPFDFATAFRRIRRAVADLPKAALFELAEDGHASTFEQLVACVISIRTRDEVMLPLARRLFAAAPTPDAVRALGAAGIDRLIAASTFHEAKARQIHAIAERTVTEFGGRLPCDEAVLRSFHGVGPKCANLVLGIACGRAAIGVDVHVHRVTNRWGVVAAPTPERTMAQLEAVLPRRWHVEINRLLVPFGKFVCERDYPACSNCPVLDMCKQVGVTKHR